MDVLVLGLFVFNSHSLCKRWINPTFLDHS